MVVVSVLDGGWLSFVGWVDMGLRGRETEGKRETQLERKKDAVEMVSYH